MASTTDEANTASTARPTRRILLAAAAVVAAAAAGGGIYLANSGSSQRPISTGPPSTRPTTTHPSSTPASSTPASSTTAGTTLSLALPSGPVHPGGATCVVFSVELLAQQQLAFSGTVQAITPTAVRLRVDHWYKGGTAGEVDLATPGHSIPLREISVNFVLAHRYLVSASSGVVRGCGYTGEYSAVLAADYAKAFGS